MAFSRRTKAFLAGAIPLGIALAFPRMGRYPGLSVIGTSLVGGALFGGSMLWLQDRATQRLTRQGIDPGDMAPVQERSVEVVGDFETVRIACRRALLRLPKVNLTSENSTTRDLTATTGMTWNSFAAKVLVRITGDGDHATVHVTSVPRLSTASIDTDGKSIENVTLFARYLLCEVPGTSPHHLERPRELKWRA